MNYEIIEQLTDVIKTQSDIILKLYELLSQHVSTEEINKIQEELIIVCTKE